MQPMYNGRFNRHHKVMNFYLFIYFAPAKLAKSHNKSPLYAVGMTALTHKGENHLHNLHTKSKSLPEIKPWTEV